MPHSPSPPKFHLFVLILLATVLALWIGWLNRPASDLHLYKEAHLPFGCVPLANKSYAVQDFGYNRLYFEGIRDHLVARPYRMEDQEKMIRQLLPKAAEGMSHGYSPVAFVLMLPLLAMPGAPSYLAYSIICALGILALYAWCLLPRVTSRLQLYGLLVCVCSVGLLTAYAVGQTTLFTTSVLGFFWLVLRQKWSLPTWGRELLLGFLFWVLCLKPNFALIPFMLLLGDRAWRPILTAFFLLAVTWVILAPYYGGFWQGLADYSFLLNHYYEGGMIPFMRHVFELHSDTGFNAYLSSIFPQWDTFFFSVSRFLYMGLSFLLVGLRWSGRLTPSEHFQGMIWNFLLFCPYLIPAEVWVLCLLIVEGAFFTSNNILLAGLKFLLLVAIVNLRYRINCPLQINFPLMLLMAVWIAVETLKTRQRDQLLPALA